jgi:hypothetical protein
MRAEPELAREALRSFNTPMHGQSANIFHGLKKKGVSVYLSRTFEGILR